MNDAGAAPDVSQPTDVAWLGRGLESLVERFRHLDTEFARPDGQATDVDLVIVGSGYGAAVAAREFAGCRAQGMPSGPPLSICILERGAEYLPGAFPSRMADLAGHVRFSTDKKATPRGRRSGLFDVRTGGDAMALVANGVGGGSLINAGVMLQPRPEVLTAAPWPKALREAPPLEGDFNTVRGWLGAGPADAPNTVHGTPLARLHKTASLQSFGGAATEAVPITVALRDGTSSVAGVPLNACIKCGDCATGCNHGAKISLDVGLLAQACNTAGVSLYTGASVLRLEKLPDAAGWVVVVQHTDDKLRLRQGTPFRLHARRVILAAGTFGSTEILLRSQAQGLALSSMLGRRFSTNGDLIAALYGQRGAVDAVASEDDAPGTRDIGPTITAMIDLRKDHGFVIQDLAVPGPLRRAFEEVFTTGRTLQMLPECDGKPHHGGDAEPCAVDPAAMRNTLPLAMVGHDDSDGCLRLLHSVGARRKGDPGCDSEGDGALRIDWPKLRDDPRWPWQHDRLRGLVAKGAAGGRVLPNPMWQLLPSDLQGSLEVPNGPTITVHPLGGCAMGDNVHEGVVDHLGCVFDPGASNGQPTATHAGLVVLDGSIVPSSLGINPALTIATLARRAALQLRELWDLGDAQPNLAPRGKRPVFRDLSQPPHPLPPRPTRIELMERMRGKARFADGVERMVELTLYSRPTALRDLMQPAPARRLEVDPERSSLRLLTVLDPPRTADNSKVKRPAEVMLLEAKLGGELTIFQREPSGGLWRTLRAWSAWLINRGLRDTVQWLLKPGKAERVGGKRQGLVGQAWAKLKESIALASHAGTARRLDYVLSLTGAHANGDEPSEATRCLVALLPDGTRVSGFKRLTYSRAANPLSQLMDMRLTKLPGLARCETPVLSLHLPFLAEQSVPLMRIVEQHDHATALGDMACFMAFTARILIDGHLWSFRKPDAPASRPPQRLPGAVAGAPPPAIVEVEVTRLVDPNTREETPVNIRLTRYRPENMDTILPPVLLIHGYSASGTTFAHPTLEPGLMAHLTNEHRRDVWVLDMRSSCGMPTAAHDWAFEDMGCEDIPVAVERVCAATGHERVDIVAHCMGVAMLFMGLLGRQAQVKDKGTDIDLPSLGQHEELRRKLWDCDPADKPPRGRIRRLVMSQVGPALLLTPTNIARAYLMRYVRQFFRGRDYAFRPSADPGLADQLLDRLLAALPYPKGEFALENPWWPLGKSLSWVGTRHRIDALFGRVFNLAHMSDATLECIDDFFGPFSVETVSQVMYFARYRMITDRSGFNRFVEPNVMRERLTFPMLSLHSAQNGLADVGTRDAMWKVLNPNLGQGGTLDSVVFEEQTLGHQDALIGTRKATKEVLKSIADFLQTP